MSSDPATIAQRYFEKMRAGDRSVVELFHDDAQLIGLGTVRSGRDEIEAFYRESIENAGPSPTLQGDILSAGDRAAAEIRIALGDGSEVHAVDIFVVQDGRIRSLTYFIEEH